MADRSKIEWLSTVNPDGSITPGATWNPIVGRTPVSAGCAQCYAVGAVHRVALCQGAESRYHELTMVQSNGVRNWTGQISYFPERLLQPLRWSRPRKIFVNSLSDLFHDRVNQEWRDNIFAAMALARQHTFIVLTKRPKAMQQYLSDPKCRMRIAHAAVKLIVDGSALDNVKHPWRADGPGNPLTQMVLGQLPDGWPMPNVWFGVSVEDQKAADERVPLLLQTPAAVRFLSCEPLLGAVNLSAWIGRERWASHALLSCPEEDGDNDGGQGACENCPCGGPDCPGRWDRGLHWVICGGESGDKARPMHPDWARSLRDQCATAGVPFFFKQWGQFLPVPVVEDARFAGGRAFDNPFGGGRSTTQCFIPRVGRPREWKDLKPGEAMGKGVMLEGDGFAVRAGHKHDAGRDLDGRTWDEFPAVAGGVS